MVNSIFKEPVYQILKKIKNSHFLNGPTRWGGDPSKRNVGLYCHYHRDRGHTMKDCRTLCDHLNQLVRAGKLNYFLHQPVEQVGHSSNAMHGNDTPWPALGTINMILTRLGGDDMPSSRVMSVVEGSDPEASDQSHKRARVMVPPSLSFSEEDKQGTL